MVKNLEKELVLLKRELAMHDTLANRSQVSHEPLSEQQRYEIRQQVRAYLDGTGDDIDVRVSPVCHCLFVAIERYTVKISVHGYIMASSVF